jgi:predicted phage-related endonuclease
MTARAIPILDNEQWHALRSEHVGGSEVAALFDEHAQLTAFELWHRKKGLLPEPDLSDNDRVFWGSCLEPAIANGVAAKTGWDVWKVGEYHSARPELGLGGSLDYKVVGQDRGPGVLEIKTADWLVAKRWHKGEPPLSYMLQIQSYLALTGWSWGCMAVLVGGNDLRLFEYDRRPKTIAIIEKRVAEFWKSIEANDPPKPDFGADHDAIAALYGTTEIGKVIDLSSSNRLPELIAEYQDAVDRRRNGAFAAKAAKAEIHSLLGDAEVANCGE